ncbi:unnamed protein product [Ilex paraguariensis]|uniref:BHLH domain-containing protein n=1 Tax=Ilex paraguariensis TaxID=185542 RepID=A0ABC8T5M3_9AQUA
MLPFQQSDELVFQIPSNPDQIQQNLSTIGHDSVGSSDLNNSNMEESLRTDENTNDHVKKKRIMHRDIERKRREEMNSLYASLRSLLPLEYIKVETGRRSTSDHIHETLNYIKHMERNIKELGIKRDKLNKMFNTNDVDNGNESSNSGSPVCVNLSPCSGGLEVLISCDFKEDDFPISRVLEVLLEEGFTVFSCISTKANEKLLHTIHSEVSDLSCVDLSALKQKLTVVSNVE